MLRRPYPTLESSHSGDLLECCRMREALSCGETLSLGDMAKSLYGYLKRATLATVHTIHATLLVLEQARSDTRRFRGSEW